MMAQMKKAVVGILAFQGDARSHQKLLQAHYANLIDTVLIHSHKDMLSNNQFIIDALIIPGGESTAIKSIAQSIYIDNSENNINFWEGCLGRWLKENRPTLGTCAGCIIMAEFGVISGMQVERNAYGSQINSFRSTVSMNGDKKDSFVEALFIRAPKITFVGQGSPIAFINGDEVVGVEYGPFMALTFHEELIPGQIAFHARFLVKNGLLPK